MSFAEVEAIYHGYGKLITNDQGNTAYLVPVGPMALLFGDHPIRPGAGSNPGRSGLDPPAGLPERLNRPAPGGGCRRPGGTNDPTGPAPRASTVATSRKEALR
jgi:hypothetical protein